MSLLSVLLSWTINGTVRSTRTVPCNGDPPETPPEITRVGMYEWDGRPLVGIWLNRSSYTQPPRSLRKYAPAQTSNRISYFCHPVVDIILLPLSSSSLVAFNLKRLKDLPISFVVLLLVFASFPADHTKLR